MFGLTVLLAMAAVDTAPDVSLWQSVLTRYVTTEGKVHYANLKADRSSIDRYIAQLGVVSPDSHPSLFPSPAARLAYWMNAYNALVVWAFVEDYPKETRRLATKLGQLNFFYRRKFRIGGRERSLDDIETVSIRRAGGDPRIHFAIVCASASCPALSRTAFTEKNLEAELERLTRQFVNEPRNVLPAKPVLRLSMIFKWYEADFGGREPLLRFLERYRTGDKWNDWGVRPRIQYIPYDWTLTDASPPA